MSWTAYIAGAQVVVMVHDERHLYGDERSDEEVHEPIVQEVKDACQKIAEKYSDTAKGVEVFLG